MIRGAFSTTLRGYCGRTVNALQWDAGGKCMSTQVVVRMPDRLVRELDQASRMMSRRRSEVIRMAVEQWVSAGSNGGQRTTAGRVRHLIGSLDSGIPDLARRHREYLIKSLRRAR
jgi:metal-responsive CopG/Arc/MetJ family transcriptional regulator